MKKKRTYPGLWMIIFVLWLAGSACLSVSAFADVGTENGISEAGSSESRVGEDLYGQASVPGNGNVMYQVLKITGWRMPEEQIFSPAELQEVLNAESLALAEDAEWIRNGQENRVRGLSLSRFLILCGADLDRPDTRVRFDQEPSGIRCSGPELADGSTKAVLLLPDQEDPGIRVLVSAGNEFQVIHTGKIVVGTEKELDDPGYGYHDRELSYMKSIVFTVNFIDQAKYDPEKGEGLPFQTLHFTMGDIENLMKAHPEQVSGNYFGISGNEDSKFRMGLGGFFDYYEGLNLSWFMTEVCGLQRGSGTALLFGREYDHYGTIRSLDYFFPDRGDYRSYYLELTGELSLNHVVPVLAVSKNGCPLLPRHDHDMEGHHEYNTFNQNAERLGFSSKIGIQKNVSGPMIAALANLDGVYGGYRNETAGDCMRIDCYVDRDAYAAVDPAPRSYLDVPENAWFASYVRNLTTRGVVNGISETAFAPDALVTRAQFVKMLACASGEVTGTDPELPFRDVNGDGWEWPYIRWAYDHRIVMGTAADRFSPDEKISRQDMAVIIDRIMRYRGMSIPENAGNLPFSDEESIADYARTAVRNQRGTLLNGYPDGSFRPQSGATRAEAAKVLSGWMDAVTAAPSTPEV